MMIWDDSMLGQVGSQAFPHTQSKIQPLPSKAELWLRKLGYPGHNALIHTRSTTFAHDIPSSPVTQPGVLCNICICSQASAQKTACPRQVHHPLQLVSMDVMGPFVIAEQNTFSGRILCLCNVTGASEEAYEDHECSVH